jgi:hypothetical protein
VGRRVGADKVVSVKLAELGDTVVVRLTLLDVRAGTQEQASQRVVQGARAPAVDAAIRGLARDAARPFAPPERSEPRESPEWYEQWYTWAGAAAAVAVGAGAVILGTAGGDEGETGRSPDVTVRPP